jgi:hypothetical protein
MSKSSGSDRHIEAAKMRLAHLGGLAAKTAADERRILDAAEARLHEVDGQLTQLRPRAVADAAAGDAYERLTMERGQLQIVIAQAQRVLASE